MGAPPPRLRLVGLLGLLPEGYLDPSGGAVAAEALGRVERYLTHPDPPTPHPPQPAYSCAKCQLRAGVCSCTVASFLCRGGDMEEGERESGGACLAASRAALSFLPPLPAVTPVLDPEWLLCSLQASAACCPDRWMQAAVQWTAVLSASAPCQSSDWASALQKVLGGRGVAKAAALHFVPRTIQLSATSASPNAPPGRGSASWWRDSVATGGSAAGAALLAGSAVASSSPQGEQLQALIPTALTAVVGGGLEQLGELSGEGEVTAGLLLLGQGGSLQAVEEGPILRALEKAASEDQLQAPWVQGALACLGRGDAGGAGDGAGERLGTLLLLMAYPPPPALRPSLVAALQRHARECRNAGVLQELEQQLCKGGVRQVAAAMEALVVVMMAVRGGIPVSPLCPPPR